MVPDWSRSNIPWKQKTFVSEISYKMDNSAGCTGDKLVEKLSASGKPNSHKTSRKTCWETFCGQNVNPTGKPSTWKGGGDFNFVWSLVSFPVLRRSGSFQLQTWHPSSLQPVLRGIPSGKVRFVLSHAWCFGRKKIRAITYHEPDCLGIERGPGSCARKKQFKFTWIRCAKTDLTCILKIHSWVVLVEQSSSFKSFTPWELNAKRPWQVHWYHKHTGWNLRRDCPRGREPPYLLTSFQSCHLVSGGFYSWCVTPHSSPSRGRRGSATIFNILNIFIIIRQKIDT